MVMRLWLDKVRLSLDTDALIRWVKVQRVNALFISKAVECFSLPRHSGFFTLQGLRKRCHLLASLVSRLRPVYNFDFDRHTVNATVCLSAVIFLSSAVRERRNV